jgi:hypothetical protein
MPYICVLCYYQIKIKQNFSHIIRVNSENGIMMGPLLGKENDERTIRAGAFCSRSV